MNLNKYIILVLVLFNYLVKSFGQDLNLFVPKGVKIDSTEYLQYDSETLRILRNSIFARHGYIFKSGDLTKYFSQFDWYNPKMANVDEFLSDTDKQNIQSILNIERVYKNPEDYKKKYFSSMPELPDVINQNDLRCAKLKYHEYCFLGIEVSKSENWEHTCYDICGKITAKNGFYVLYRTSNCPAASAEYSEFNINLYTQDFNLKRKIKLFSEDGIFDIGFFTIRNDTLITKLEKYKGGYWDGYEESFKKDSIPFNVLMKKYILNFENTEIRQIE